MRSAVEVRASCRDAALARRPSSAIDSAMATEAGDSGTPACYRPARTVPAVREARGFDAVTGASGRIGAMTTAPAVHPVTPNDQDEVAGSLARAFVDDPVWKWLTAGPPRPLRGALPRLLLGHHPPPHPPRRRLGVGGQRRRRAVGPSRTPGAPSRSRSWACCARRSGCSVPAPPPRSRCCRRWRRSTPASRTGTSPSWAPTPSTRARATARPCCNRSSTAATSRASRPTSSPRRSPTCPSTSATASGSPTPTTSPRDPASG